MKINDWIRENTYHHSAFADLKTLVEQKKTSGLTISLCIPTLNEEKTIGKEVVIFKSEMMKRYPILDEIAVVDSGSADRTLEVASSFGADTYLSAEILPGEGSKTGKGENLWKAIYQLKGDIIVYIDADIKNIHPRFVYGLIGPLIFRPEVSYVKAFYDRPLTFSDSIRPSGGGRVTEILTRPLFSVFFPELTAIIQPLSGEYAVRRSVLETISFPVGYGVETSHLIDVYQKHGMKTFAQTDLDQRVHRNQETRDLGKMSFGIIQTFLRRLRRHGIINSEGDYPTVLRQFQAHDDLYETIEWNIPEYERPPMITIPEYRKARNLSPN
ncbi:Glucosyl-3-phosphoglycerate synthase [Olavius algarvensis spirochete endosymbiont]|uniref:glucosyl-3-phosphoglycerate synthase n=1 Tax=Olavius algarvensis spirochete endosymbiont TaxID=260710 RepID=UPI00052DA6B9|nr:glucosyl-3-phosphoglycerate synthase [Olavius algarvensis spirochete endosymbiont]KGM43102.1 glucosyl-3-phosphoglycerate synthase [Alkalispirochaeta odontotermitis]CAD7840771.1 MAG: Glucosyl-3-phosphoglycerate synthase (EC 2.4.1.266) [Olavius algarvensis spirochete endosymbiont]VDB00588.1 Glucosyl-3-phosphoglycerate synthase [Olavius algarvensis spirochete endosymbiont]